MNTRWLRALLCALALALSACGQKSQSDVAPSASGELAARAKAPMAPPAPVAAPAMNAGANATAADAPVRRHLALRHDLAITTDADAVEAAWRSANDACVAAGCELLSSSLLRDDAQRPARATLEARVPPEKFDAFLQRVTALGTVGQHTKTAQDKTDEVIDVEARIKNATAFRDHLRQLMATPGAKLKDVIEVERELVRVQSELDSFASRRKALANQTEKVHVSLQFSARPAMLEQGMWAPVRHAFLSAGHLFASSLGALLSFIVAVLPWAIALVLLGLALRPRWRRWRARRP